MKKYIKIYTNAEEYFNDIEYYCNASGELHRNGNDITEEDLPPALQDAYRRLWSDNYGSLCYLMKYKERYGIAFIKEYHEFTPEGKIGEINNFQKCLKVAEELKKTYFSKAPTIFIGREMGFPGETPKGMDGDDKATELVVFMDANISEEELTEVADWLYDNAYEPAEGSEGNTLRDWVSESGEYIIPVSWSVNSTVTVKGVRNLGEAIRLAKRNIDRLPTTKENEYVEDSYKIDIYTDEDALNAQNYATIGDVVLHRNGIITK